jgi:cytochrome P460
MSRMPKIRVWVMALGAAALAALGGMALAAQDKYALQVPNGLAFSEFRGYEDWEVVSVSQTEALLKVIVANPAMIDAYRSGVPGNGKPFPDGSKIAKIEWTIRKSTEAPFSVNVPNKLHDVNFIEKDSKRFADSGGWGYALFDYDASAEAYKPNGSGVTCGFECHKIVTTKDYIFHPYQNR